MRIPKKALLLATRRGEPEAGAIDFDGTNDYLSRSVDLVGNVDGKTFTFSCWVYPTPSAGGSFDIYNVGEGSTPYFQIQQAAGQIYIIGYTSSRGSVFTGVADYTFPKNTFTHILISLDTSSSGSRHLYINDEPFPVNWSAYSLNNIVDFTRPEHYLASYLSVGRNLKKIRLAHVYLDYTYRDLSIEANRRLFITDDGKPAKGQADLSPILYLPLDDFEAPGVNLGTGGDFALNGVVAQSGRGPNQWNCVASEFDGSTDYLRRTSALTGASDGGVFTISFLYKPNDLSGAGVTNSILCLREGAQNRFYVYVNSVGTIGLEGYNSSNTTLLNINSLTASETGMVEGKWSHVAVCIDLYNTANRFILIDGVDVTASANFSTYTAGSIRFGATEAIKVSQQTSGNYIDGSLGELYFDTTYIDLSTNNPFWAAGVGKPKPVLQVLEETGNTPLIAMPIRADDAGRNYGTGGGFEVFSGPFVGARGASEFWARSAKFDGSTGYLELPAPSGLTDSKKISIVFAIKPNSTNSDQIFFVGNYKVQIVNGSSSIGMLLSINGSSNTFFNTGYQNSLIASNGVWSVYHFSIDGDSEVYQFYKNGQLKSFTPSTVNFNQQIEWSSFVNMRFGRNAGTTYGNTSQSMMYVSNQYIDFSQESERLKFVDAFGYPVDIRPAIKAGDIPAPLIYMPFDDPNDLGKNLGTGGDFTVNGTVTPGADVDPN